MSVDIKFFHVSAASGDGDGHTISQTINGGAASAGDVLVVNSVSYVGVTAVVTDNISGATGWAKIGDSLSAGSNFRTQKWWKLCVGGETSVSADYGAPGNGRAFGAVICRGMGSLNEAYLIGEALAQNHFSDQEYGYGDGHGTIISPSTDGEVYIGCTAIGNTGYSYAGFNGSKGTHDNNGVGGDGANDGGGSVGFGEIMHINDEVSINVTTDQLDYGSRPQGMDVWHSWIGIRVGVAIIEGVDTTIGDYTRAGESDKNLNPNVTALGSFDFFRGGESVFSADEVAPPEPPVNTVSPSIDNTSPMDGDTLTVDDGTWTGDATIVFTYQWYNYDGSEHSLSGETDATYVVTGDVVGTAIFCRVTGTNDADAVDADTDNTDNVLAAGTDYTDAATVAADWTPSAVERYTPFVEEETPAQTEVFDVDDHSPTIYVRSGRAGIIAVSTTDEDVTFVLQTSPDGEHWYTAINDSGDPYTYAVTADSPVAFTTPPGWFHTRLLCTVADDGPATVSIQTSGGY